MGNNFRENLRSELDFQGITVKELSARTRIPVATLDCYLGTRSTIPSAYAAFKIAHSLEVSVEYLLFGENEGTKLLKKRKTSHEARELVKCIESLNSEQCRAIHNMITNFLKPNK